MMLFDCQHNVSLSMSIEPARTELVGPRHVVVPGDERVGVDEEHLRGAPRQLQDIEHKFNLM